MTWGCRVCAPPISRTFSDQKQKIFGNTKLLLFQRTKLNFLPLLPTGSHNQFSTIKTMRLQVQVFFRSLGRTWSLKISAWIHHNHWNLLSVIRWALSKLNGFEVIYSESFELNQRERKSRWFGAIKMRPGNSHLNKQKKNNFEPRY